MERENKQLRLKIHDLQERMESRRPRPVSTADADTRQLQQELIVRNMVRIVIPSNFKYLSESLSLYFFSSLTGVTRSKAVSSDIEAVFGGENDRVIARDEAV